MKHGLKRSHDTTQINFLISTMQISICDGNMGEEYNAHYIWVQSRLYLSTN